MTAWFLFSIVLATAERSDRETAPVTVCALLPHVHNLNFRQRFVINPPRKANVGVLPSTHVLERFQGGRRGTKQHDAVAHSCAHDGDVPRVVPRIRILLFVTPVVLLVHNYQPDITYGREYCRPGAYCHFLSSFVERPPRIKAFAGSQLTVQDRDVFLEP